MPTKTTVPKNDETKRVSAVRITRPLLCQALTWHCPRYTRNGGPGEPPHACREYDGTFSSCPGAAGLCSQVFDVFRTMVKIKNGEIIV